MKATMEGGESSGLKSQLIRTQERSHDLEDEERSGKDCCRANIVEEAKLQLRLAGPLITVSLLQYSLQVISVMFNGHLGELPLSGSSMGSSFASVTGFTVLVNSLCAFSSPFLSYIFLAHRNQKDMIYM
jgi:MATE family multidrug resistance protein